jgi:hypothetical protein
MEYSSARMKYEIMLFAGKWMELQVIMLSHINRVKEEKCWIFISYTEPRPSEEEGAE